MGESVQGISSLQPFRWYVVIGAGLWWGLSMFSFYSNAFPFTFSGEGYGDPDRFGAVAVVVALALGFRVLARPAARRWLSLLVVCLSMAQLAVYVAELVGGPIMAPWLSAAVVVAGWLSHGVVLQLWGARFAFLKPSDVAYTMLFTAGVASIVYLLFWIFPYSSISFMHILVIMCSCILFILDNNTGVPVVFADQLNHSFIKFCLSRAAFGLVIGLVQTLFVGRSMQGDLNLTIPVSLLCIGTLIVFLRFLVNANHKVMELIPLAPLGVTVLLSLPFIAGTDAFLAMLAPSLVWLFWAMLSSLQVSRLAPVFGINEVALTSVDKAIAVMFMACGRGVGDAVLSSGVFAESIHVAMTEILLLGVITIVSAVLLKFTIKQFMHSRDHEVLVEKRNGFLAACSTISDRFGLTARESEILVLLCRGMTQAQICDLLSVAGGTVRTHVHHIHQKMGIHRNEELLDMVSIEVDAIMVREGIVT